MGNFVYALISLLIMLKTDAITWKAQGSAEPPIFSRVEVAVLLFETQQNKVTYTVNTFLHILKKQFLSSFCFFNLDFLNT